MASPGVGHSGTFPHRRSQNFVWDALFFTQKVDDLFSGRPQNRRQSHLNNPSHRSPQFPQKIELLLCLGGALSARGVNLQLSPVNLAQIHVFSPPCTCVFFRLHVHPAHPLYTPMPPRLPTISFSVHFGVNLTANYPNVVRESSWCRCQQITALSISTASVIKILFIEQLLHPAVNSPVTAP